MYQPIDPIAPRFPAAVDGTADPKLIVHSRTPARDHHPSFANLARQHGRAVAKPLKFHREW
jgi:hypothetical protein